MGNTTSSSRSRSLRWTRTKKRTSITMNDKKDKRRAPSTVSSSRHQDEGSDHTRSSTRSNCADPVRSTNRPSFQQDSVIPDSAPEEIKVLREYLRAKDAFHFEKMNELTADRCDFIFVDAQAEMPSREFYAAVKDTHESFPDLHFFWKDMSITGTTDRGVTVVVTDYYGVGKHTGKPYGFGPYEPVPATGIAVKDENIEMTFTVKHGKIARCSMDAFGKLVGPPGFYTKIGGLII